MSSKTEGTRPLLSPNDMLRHDGIRWRKFETHNGSSVILTLRGLELLRFNPSLRGLMRAYGNAATKEQVREGTHSQFRKYFRSGGNSTVYRLGETEILIKEAERKKRPSLWDALNRMDYLYDVCMKHLDPYVLVPDHYGLFVPSNSETEYLMMKKINSGITVRDVLRRRVLVSDSVVSEVDQDFSLLKDKITNAIRLTQISQPIPFRNLLPDWSDENVLVDFTTALPNKPYTLWVIDQ